MTGMGRMLIVAGLVIAAIGALLALSGKIPWLGRLPGDIMVRKERFTFYFPLATSLLVSVVLSLILWLIRK
jgi:hypothetical protein